MKTIVLFALLFSPFLGLFGVQVKQSTTSECSNQAGIQAALEGYDLIYLTMSGNSFRLWKFDFDLFSPIEVDYTVPSNATGSFVLSPDTTKLALGVWSDQGGVPEIQVLVIDFDTGETRIVFQEQSDQFTNLMHLNWTNNTTLSFIVNYRILQYITVTIDGGSGYTDRSLISFIDTAADEWFAVFNSDYSSAALVELMGDLAVVRFVDLAVMELHKEAYSTPAVGVFAERNFAWGSDNQHFLIMDGESRNWLSISPVSDVLQVVTNVGDRFYLTLPAPAPNTGKIAFRGFPGRLWKPESVFLGIWDGSSIHEIPTMGWPIVDRSGWHPQSRFFAFVTTTHDEIKVLDLLDTEDNSYCELDRSLEPYAGAYVIGWSQYDNST